MTLTATGFTSQDRQLHHDGDARDVEKYDEEYQGNSRRAELPQSEFLREILQRSYGGIAVGLQGIQVALMLQFTDGI